MRLPLFLWSARRLAAHTVHGVTFAEAARYALDAALARPEEVIVVRGLVQMIRIWGRAGAPAPTVPDDHELLLQRLCEKAIGVRVPLSFCRLAATDSHSPPERMLARMVRVAAHIAHHTDDRGLARWTTRAARRQGLATVVRVHARVPEGVWRLVARYVHAPTNRPRALAYTAMGLIPHVGVAMSTTTLPPPLVARSRRRASWSSAGQ